MEQILEYLLVAVAVVLMFGASIFVHELGHFLMALVCRMRIEAFAIGLGPKIVGWVRNGIEYSLRWIPAGGFVRLPQMVTSEALEGGDGGHREWIPPAPPGAKFLVAIAGPLMNLVFAFFIATIIYFVGLPVLVNPSIIGHVDPNSPEGKLGIHRGDRIVAVNGKPVTTWDQINTITILAPTNEFNVTIEDHGVRKTYKLTAKTNPKVGLKWLDLDPLERPIIGAIQPGMPAAKAGLKKGDRFVTFGGVPVLGQDHLKKLVAKSEGKESQVVVERDGHLITTHVTPVYDPTTKRGRIGIIFAGGVYEVMRPGPTPWAQFTKVWDRTIGVLGALLNSKHTGVKASDLSGPVGILSMMAVQTRTDPRLALDFLVLLNINLLILNLLPIPVLDGGHILMAIIEQLRGRPLNLKLIEYTNTAFAVLLISFMLYVTFFDVRRLPLFGDLFRNDVQVEVVNPSTTNTNPPVTAPPASSLNSTNH